MRAIESVSSHPSPKFIAPKHSSLTCTPVRPKDRYFIDHSVPKDRSLPKFYLRKSQRKGILSLVTYSLVYLLLNIKRKKNPIFKLRVISLNRVVPPQKKLAFTLVEIMIVLLITTILFAIAVPNFMRARATSRQKSCLANLRQIVSSKEQWAMDFHKGPSSVPTWPADLVGTDRYIRGTTPVCPTDGSTYSPNALNTLPQCGNPNATTGPDMSTLPHQLD
jgi:competence protein ComGC